MAKFIIECPSCGTLNPASSFIFSKRVIKCGNCATEIKVKENKLASRTCPFCHNVFLYDQTKRKNICPACKKDLSAGFSNLLSFPCPDCGCTLHVDQNAKSTDCPVCDRHIPSVESEVAKAGLVSDTKLSVIKYEGDNSTFVWKHPIEDFNIGSQLIVHESQEAVVLINGEMLPVFTAGRHTLKTENIPYLRKFLDFVMEGDPFHAEVYFINKTVQMSIPWGTAEKVHITDPDTNAVLEIGAFGELNLQVYDSVTLLKKLVGTTNGIAWKEKDRFSDSLEKAFRPLIGLTVKSNLPSIIRQEGIDILKIDEKLERISSILGMRINEGFSQYGLTAPEFYIRGIAYPPETDPAFRIIKELHNEKLRHMADDYEAGLVASKRKVITEQQETALMQERHNAELRRIKAQAEADATAIKDAAEIRQRGLYEAEVMAAKGYTERDVLQAEVQKAYAEGIGNMTINGTGGGIASDMMGLGIGMAAAGVVSGQASEMFKGFGNTNPVNAAANEQPAAKAQKITCPDCGKEVPENSKFCLECGTKIEILAEDEVICPACGMKTHKGKFCMECGAALIAKCANCGKELPNGTKFCPECGTPTAKN